MISRKNSTKQTRVIIQGFYALSDPVFWLVLFAGFIIWLRPPPVNIISWEKLLLMSFLEEFVFRFSLQESLNKFFKYKKIVLRISVANLLTSVIFVILHLLNHPPIWAISVFLPSLIFGWAWDRYQNLIPCWCLHFVYNLLYFYRFG